MNVILTDDPLRAKMLCAHHLENAVAVRENEGSFAYMGSYKNASIILISSGYGDEALLASLCDIKRLGAERLIYLGECTSDTRHYALRSVILAEGGDRSLLSKANRAAARYTIPVFVHPVCTPGDTTAECCGITDSATGTVYGYTLKNSLAALSVLTVSLNTERNEQMEQHERSSRLYAAALLVFETLAI